MLALGVCAVLFGGCGENRQTQEELVVEKGQEGREEGEGDIQEPGQEEGQGGMEDGAQQEPVEEQPEDTQTDGGGGNVASQVQAPERYQTELSVDGVHLMADAQMVIPDVSGIKTKTVTSRVFTQEDYDAVNRVLLGGSPLWERDYAAMEASNGFTVGELEERIAQLKAERDVNGVDGDAPYGDKEETLNEQIEAWERRKAAAEASGLEEPVIIEEIPAIVSYKEPDGTKDSEGADNWLGGYATMDGEDYYVYLNNNLEQEWRMVELAVEGMRKKGSFAAYLYSSHDYEQNEEKMAAMGLDTEGLLAQTGDWVNQMGIGEYTVQGGEYMANSKVGEKGKMEYDQFVYGTHIVRVEDGVPVTYTHVDGGMIDNAATGDMGQIWWPYEEITLIYDEDGMVAFYWRNPYEVKALSAEYVFLMPFSDIREIFEEMLVKKKKDAFNGEGESFEITVDEVRLGYMRVREADSAEGTLVPVWDFFGAETWKDAEGREYYSVDSDYVSLLTINAMDGTVLDREQGL